MAGRPRAMADAVILRAAAEVIGRTGPARLTLAAVADEVGLVAGTLVQRFGSKHGLLVALAEHSAAGIDAHYEQLREGYASPSAALEALIVGAMAPVSTPDSFANHLAFLCQDLTDPQLRVHALTIQQAQAGAIRALLDQAVDAGELAAETDTAMLAAVVQALISGAGLNWALDRRGTLAERLREILGAVLAPHRIRHDHPQEGT